jgi:hypothetical protein
LRPVFFCVAICAQKWAAKCFEFIWLLIFGISGFQLMVLIQSQKSRSPKSGAVIILLLLQTRDYLFFVRLRQRFFNMLVKVRAVAADKPALL